MWTVKKLKSLLKRITSPTVESEDSQISNNLELLFVLAPYGPWNQKKYLAYSQFNRECSLSFNWRINYTS